MASPNSASSRTDPRTKLRGSSPPRRPPLITALGETICPFPRAKGARGPLAWLHGALCSPHHAAALLRAPAALFFLLLIAAWISGALHWPLFSLPTFGAVESAVGPTELAVEMARLEAIESLTSRLSTGSAKRRDDLAAGGDVERRAPRKMGGGNAHPTTKRDERGTVNEESSGGVVVKKPDTQLTKLNGKEVAQDTDLLVEQDTSAGNARGLRIGDGMETEEWREDANEGGDASDALNESSTSEAGSGKGTGREERTSEETVVETKVKTGEAREAGGGPGEKRGEEDEGRRGGGNDDSEEDTGGVDRDRLDPATPFTHGDGASAALSGNEGDFTAAVHDPPPTAAVEQDAATDVSDHSTSSPPSDENASSESPNGNDDVSQASPSVAQPSCDGRRVFVYSMPPVFNDDIVRTACDDDPLLAWLTCDAFRNRAQGSRLPANRDGGRALIAALLAAKMEKTAQARGEGKAEDAEAGEWAWLHRWYSTEQHQIEAHFRTRLENHPCRTHDDTEADVILVPAYMGWNAYKNTLHPGHFPHPGLALKEFLLGQPAFQRTKGARHVVVLGRAIWDFANHHQVDDPPHYNVVFVPELANVTFLSVEQPPYRESYATPIFSVPYTTTFHPASLTEINHWLALVAARRRPFLFSYVGGRRPSGTTSGPLRKALIAQCERAGNATCLWMKCTGGDEVGQELPLFTAADAAADAGTALGAAVEAVVGSAAPRDAEGEDVAEWVPSGCYDTWQVAVVMLQSRFCLQPTGDSSVRRSTFDSLLAGCIPVFFKEESFNMQYPWHFPEDRSSISVTLDEARVLNGTVDVAAELAAIPEERVASMQARIRELVPQLLYRHMALPRGGDRGEGRVGGNAEGGAVENNDGEWKDAFDVSFDSLQACAAARCGVVASPLLTAWSWSSRVGWLTGVDGERSSCGRGMSERSWIEAAKGAGDKGAGDKGGSHGVSEEKHSSRHSAEAARLAGTINGGHMAMGWVNFD
ncbi:unnamed protein product [Closterium sp. Naga37s-1]|nr:unnamed protein product [Closterium sp. Naga37s-1]